MSESVNVENKRQNRQKPPRSLGRIACEILAGAATAAALAFSSVYVIGYGAKNEKSHSILITDIAWIKLTRYQAIFKITLGHMSLN